MPKELVRLVLPRPVLRRLETAGVYCQTASFLGTGLTSPPRVVLPDRNHRIAAG